MSGYCLRIITTPMVSDCEEDSDHFPAENRNKTAEFEVGSYPAVSTDHWTAGSGITNKIPPLFDVSTSWFKYEELIDDFLDFTVLEAEKQGPSLKNRLVGDAQVYEGLLDRESPRVADGGKYFRDTLRPHFIKGAPSVFLWRSYQFTRARRGNVEMVKSIEKFSLHLKRFRDAWMDMLPLFIMSEERRQIQYLADVNQENEERQRRNADILDPDAPETRDRWYATQVSIHEQLFPFENNLTTVIFIVTSDLSEAQSERLTSSLSLRRMNVTA